MLAFESASDWFWQSTQRSSAASSRKRASSAASLKGGGSIGSAGEVHTSASAGNADSYSPRPRAPRVAVALWLVIPAKAGIQFLRHLPSRRLDPGSAEGRPVLSLSKGRDDGAEGDDVWAKIM